MAEEATPIYQLKVTLTDIKPPVGGRCDQGRGERLSAGVPSGAVPGEEAGEQAVGVAGVTIDPWRVAQGNAPACTRRRDERLEANL